MACEVTQSPAEGPHQRVWEYDGAFKCLDCQSQWGALPGNPQMPDTCQSPAEGAEQMTVDSASTSSGAPTEILVREATDYMHAVETLFSIQPEGDCLAERKPSKDTKAYSAFMYLNDQGRLLRDAIAAAKALGTTSRPVSEPNERTVAAEGAKDTLVEWLRADTWNYRDALEAADRIERFENEIGNLCLLADSAERERDKYKAALAELVRLRNERDLIDNIPRGEWLDQKGGRRLHSNSAEMQVAWEAARAALQDLAQEEG